MHVGCVRAGRARDRRYNNTEIFGHEPKSTERQDKQAR